MPLRLFLLRLYYFFSFAALGVQLPFLPRWLEARGIEGLAMGAVMATVPAMGLVAPPTFGFIADALGLRGYLLRIACGGAGLVMGLVALTGAVGRPLGFAGLFFAVLAFAFFRSPMIPMADVIAMEETKTGSATYPRIRLWGSIGFLVTAVVAGRLLDPGRLTPLPLAMAAALFIAAAASFGLPSRAAATPVPSPGQVRALLRSADFPVFLVASLLSQAAHSSYDICYSLHLRDLGLSGAVTGAAWGIGVFAEVALMAFSAPLFARFSAPRLLAFAFAAASLRWILIATVRDEVALLALQPLHAASFGMMWIASLAYIKARVPPSVLATGQGLFVAATAAGGGGGALLWGPLYHRAGGSAVFGAAALLAALGSALALVLAGRADRAGRANYFASEGNPG